MGCSSIAGLGPIWAVHRHKTGQVVCWRDAPCRPARSIDPPQVAFTTPLIGPPQVTFTAPFCSGAWRCTTVWWRCFSSLASSRRSRLTGKPDPPAPASGAAASAGATAASAAVGYGHTSVGEHMGFLHIATSPSPCCVAHAMPSLTGTPQCTPCWCRAIALLKERGHVKGGQLLAIVQVCVAGQSAWLGARCLAQGAHILLKVASQGRGTRCHAEYPDCPPVRPNSTACRPTPHSAQQSGRQPIWRTTSMHAIQVRQPAKASLG